MPSNRKNRNRNNNRRHNRTPYTRPTGSRNGPSSFDPHRERLDPSDHSADSNPYTQYVFHTGKHRGKTAENIPNHYLAWIRREHCPNLGRGHIVNRVVTQWTARGRERPRAPPPPPLSPSPPPTFIGNGRQRFRSESASPNAAEVPWGKEFFTRPMEYADRHRPAPAVDRRLVSRNEAPIRRPVQYVAEDMDEGSEEEEEEEEEDEPIAQKWTPPNLNRAPPKFKLGRTNRYVSGAYIRKAFNVTIHEVDEAGIQSYLKPGQKNKKYSLYHLWAYAIQVKGMSQRAADAAVESEKNRSASSSARYKSYLSGDYAGGEDMDYFTGFY